MACDNQETDPEDKMVGVYICHCGGDISDHMDVARLAKTRKAWTT